VLCALTTLEMSGMDAVMSLRVIEAVSASASLTHLDLNGSVLDNQCWPALTELSNKVALQQLVLRRCSVEADLSSDGDILDVFVDFFHSAAVRKSLTLLDMADMRWTNVKPILIFEALFQSERGAHCDTQNDEDDLELNSPSRSFRCDLTRFVMDAQSVLDCADCIEHVLSVLSTIGVTELALDEFHVDARALEESQTLSALDVVNEIMHCFAQREYAIESLSLKGVEFDDADDFGLFADLVGAVRLRHFTLPRIQSVCVADGELWLRLMEKLANSSLQSVEVDNEDEIGQAELRIFNNAESPPMVTTNQISGVDAETADGQLNRYAANLILHKHCGGSQ